jgi:hypothetical protein
MADGLDHPLHLMLTSLMDGDFKPGIALCPADLIDLGRGSEAVFQFDAAFERVDLGIVEYAFNLDEICLGHVIAGMEQRLGQVPMICQQHEPFTIEIQPPDGEHTHRNPAQKILHGRATLRIVERGHDVLRFVENHVDIGLRGPEMFAVDLDVVPVRVNLGAKLLHHVAVDGHASGRNQFLGLAARGQSGTGNQFLETNFHSV